MGKFIFVGILIWVGLVAAQCAAPTEIAPAPVNVTPVTLTYVTWTSEGDLLGRAERQLFKQFETSQPRITISLDSYGQNSTRDYLTAAEPPDILFVWPYEDSFTPMKEGLLLEVTDVWQQLKLGESLPPQFVTMAEVDGKKYHVPIIYGWTAMYYNKAIFDQYHLTPPQTWAEFLKVCDTLVENDITPIALPGDGPWASSLWFDYLNLRLNGPEFHARLINGEERYDTAQVNKVLETWRELQQKKYFVAEPMRWTYEDVISAVVQGDDKFLRPREPAAMLLNNSFFFDETPPKFVAELDFFRFPTIDPAMPQAEVVDSMGYMISVHTKHPLEAREFLVYMASAPAQQQLMQQMQPMAIYLPALNVIDTEKLPSALQKGQDLVQNAHSIGTPFFADIPGAMRGEVLGGLQRFLQGADIDKVLTDLEAARQRIYR
jgi:ABC-type glycerol-3-phosphate transport system substrate-binding protein